MSVVLSSSSESVGSLSSLRSAKFKKALFSFPIRWETSWDYISFSLSYLVTVDSITSYYKVARQDGNTVQYVVIYLFVALPIFYMQLVLGQYTQGSILYAKYMIPFSHGLTYTMLLNVFYETLKYGYYMTDFILYFLTSMQAKLPWMRCPKYSEPGTCYDGIAAGPNCTESCISNTTHVSSYMYYMNVYLDLGRKNPNAKSFIPNIHRFVSLLVSWFITFLFVHGAYKKRKKILTSLLCIIFLLVTILIAGTMATTGGMTGANQMLKFRMNSLYSLQTWSKMCSRIIQDMAFGRAILILAGSRLKAESHSGMLSVLCCILASIASFICSLLLKSCIGIIMKATHTSIVKSNLLQLEYFSLSFYTHIPQGLGYLSCPQMWSLSYFFCSICILLCNQITHMTTIHVSIADMHPSINRYQVYFLGLFCTMGTLIGFVLLGDQNFAYTYLFILEVTSFIELFNILFLCITVFWIYGVRRLCDDIHFLTGAQPTKFWKITWYALPVIIAVTCYCEYSFFTFEQPKNVEKKTFTLVMFFISTSSIPIFVGIEIFRHIRARNMLGMFQPADMWGPADPEERHKRQMFNPRTENRYKSHSKLCQHTCLLNSKILKNIFIDESYCRNTYLESVNQHASASA